MTIAITLIAGAALFGYVNDEAATNEQQYGQAVGGTVNFLNEQFVVVNMAFPSGSNSVELWLYNNGQVALQISQITLYDSANTQLNLAYPGYTSSSTTQTAAPSGSFCVEDGVTEQVQSSQLTTSPALAGVSIPAGSSPTAITLQLPSGCTLTSGTTYNVNVLGAFGNDIIYYSVYNPGS
jgi:archaellum component FlaF (FlaF/FlaG flagellin family)